MWLIECVACPGDKNKRVLCGATDVFSYARVTVA